MSGSPEKAPIGGSWSVATPVLAGLITTVVACAFLLHPADSIVPGGFHTLYINEYVKAIPLLALGPLVVCLAFLLWLSDPQREAPPLRIAAPLAVYVGGVLVSNFQSFSFGYGAYEALYVFLLPPLAGLIPGLLLRWGKREVLWILVLALSGGAVVGAIGVEQILGGGTWFPQLPRLSDYRGASAGSLMYNQNLAAEYLILLIPSGLAMVLLTKGWSRYLAGAITFLMTLHLIFTFARGAWVGLLAGIVSVGALLLIQWRLRGGGGGVRKGKVIGFLGAIMGLGLVVGLAAPGGEGGGLAEVKEQFLSIFTHGSPVRWATWTDSVAMLRDKWAVGVGPGHYKFHILNYVDHLRDHVTWNSTTAEFHFPHRTHNDYLQIWLEGGVVSFLGFFALCAGILWEGAAGLNRFMGKGDGTGALLMAAALSAWVALLVSALFEFPFRMPATSMAGWLMGGVILALARVTRPVYEVRARNAWRFVGVLLALGTMIYGTHLGTRVLLSSIYRGQSKVAMELKKTDKVVLFMNKAYEYEPLMDMNGPDKVRAEISLKRYDQALESVEQVLREQPFLGPAIWYRALTYIQLGMYKKALPDLRVLERKHPYIKQAPVLARQIEEMG